jgi:hypothetical protein
VSKHYIGMNGSHGCLPDSCSVYKRFKHAVESLTDSLDLTDEQADDLRETGSAECNPGQGAEYCEIVACECKAPWTHDEMMTEEHWRGL